MRQSSRLTYLDVKGNNLTKGTWITIGVLAGIGVVVLALLAARLGNE